MKLSGNQSTSASARLITAVALAATLAVAPAVDFAANKYVHKDRVELRIKDMHAKLKITPAEEEQWAKVTQAMIDDAKTMDTLTQARFDHSKDMTAVDSLKSYDEIAQAHADGIKKMIPVFSDLYASMPDTQKKLTDKFFRHAGHRHGHKILNHK